MNPWKLAAPVGGLMASLVAIGCAPPVAPDPLVALSANMGPGAAAPAAEPAPVEAEEPPAEVTVQAAPPPAMPEVEPAAPPGDYVWLKGYWHWNGGTWAWIRGHHARRRADRHWVEARYAHGPRGWVYVGPHWAR